MNTITSKLFKHVRDIKCINQRQLAKVLQVNQSTISRIENKLRAPGYILLRRLSRFTGKSIKVLIEEIRNTP